MRNFTDVSCRFYLREPAPGGFTYTQVGSDLPMGALPTAHPPLVGDLVGLAAELCRVVARQWSYPAYGSMAWPAAGDALGSLGLTVVVERAEGLFADEVELPPAGREHDHTGRSNL